MNKIKNSLISGDIPQLDQMEPGDIGINNADGSMFIMQLIPPQNGQTLPTKAVVQISGVTSFEGRLGAITLQTSDISTALGYTPVNPAHAALTGAPSAPTATSGANTTQIATTAFVQNAIKSLTSGGGVTALSGLSDVSVTESSLIDGYSLLYSNSASAWVATQLATVAKTGQYSSLTGIPTFAAVATSGSYTDLSNTPAAYVLPKASQSILGGVKAGAGTVIATDGTLSVPLVTTLAGLTDVTVTESATIDANVLQYSNSVGKWQAKKLANIAFSGSYTDLTNVPAYTGITSFNTRTGAITLQASDVTGVGAALLASPTFTGTPQAPTALAGTNTTQIATTAFVTSAITAANNGVATFNSRTGAVTLQGSDITGAGGALLAGPAFTGVPTAPTATAGANTTQLATTAFVSNAIANIHIDTSTSLQNLTDVLVTEGNSINGYFLAFNSAQSKWVAQQLSSVALSGNYTNLTNTPTLAAVATSGKYSDLTGSPVLATVATTGKYSDLTGTPSAYSLPIATASALGGVKSGSGVTIAADGTISVATISTLAGMSDVSVVEGSGINGNALVYSSSASKWQAQPLATIATSGKYSDLIGTPTSVSTFNTRSGTVTLTSSDVTTALGFTPANASTVSSPYAGLASPAFTGTPTAPTATIGNNSTQLATTAFVTSALSAAGVGVASFNTRTGAITLQSSDITSAGGALLAGPTFSGTPSAPTAALGTNTSQLATTAFVYAANNALLVSPTFTGTPNAPTPALSVNNNQIATTSFVYEALSASTQVGALGQVGFLKSDGITVQYDQVVQLGAFINSDAQLTTAEQNVVTQQTVFNTWQRFSHNSTGTYPANATEEQSWSYNSTTQAIQSTINSTTYLGFVSLNTYDSYTLQAQLSSDNSDNDIIGLVIAFATDSAGKQYTLSAVRSVAATGNADAGSLDNTSAWKIVYNYLQSTQYVVADGASLAPVKSGAGWSTQTNGTTVQIVRAGDAITATCSQFGSTALDGTTTLSVNLTTDSRLAIFRGPQSYGFSAYSQVDATFTNVYFSKTQNIIYDVRNGNVYIANSAGTWAQDTTSTLFSRIGSNRLLYNAATTSLYYTDPSSKTAVPVAPGLISPAFTGTPTAPTATPGTNTTQLATTGFVTNAISGLIGGIVYQGTWNASTNTPTLASGTGTKGWMYKVSTAGTTTIDGNSSWSVGDMLTFDGTVWDKIDGQATQVISFNSRTGAITLTSADITSAGGALLASPALTGTPTAPTPAQFDSSTKLATTAFVKANGFNYPTAGVGINASATLTITQLNGWGQFQAASVTSTLPTLATAPLGSTFTYIGGGFGGTIKPNGSDVLQNVFGTNVTSIAVAQGETITVAANGNGSAWFVVDDGVGQGSIGNFSGIVAITSAASTLPAAPWGYVYEASSSVTAAISTALPAASTTNSGKKMSFYNASAYNWTLTAGNFNSSQGGSVTSMVLEPGSTAELFHDGASYNCIAGTYMVGGAGYVTVSSAAPSGGQPGDTWYQV